MAIPTFGHFDSKKAHFAQGYKCPYLYDAKIIKIFLKFNEETFLEICVSVSPLCVT